MDEKVIYRRLNFASLTLLLVIAIAIILLISETLPLSLLKIGLAVLLLTACVIFWLLRLSINETLKLGKQRIRSAELKFERIVESNLIGVLISNREGVVLQANDAFLNMVGYNRRDLRKSKILWEEVIMEESKEDISKALKELEKVGYYKPLEKLLERKDGSKLWVLCGSAALGDVERGNIISYVIDISKRKAAEEMAVELQKKIKTQQEEFESVFMNAPAFISIRRGSDLRFVFINNAIRALSYRDNHIGKTRSEVFINAITRNDEFVAEQVYKTGKAISGTAYRIDFKDKAGQEQTIYMDYILTPVYDHDGKVDGVAFFGYDVTELVTTIQKLDLSHDQFAFLADTMADKVWITDEKGVVKYLNKAWLEYANIGPGEIDGFKWIDTVPPDEVKTIENLWEQCMRNGTPYNYEGQYRRFDGEYRWHTTHAVPFKDAKGTIVYWVGINTDVHEQKMQLQRLQDNEAYFRDLSEETPFIVWKSDRVGKCVYLNKKWTEITGLTVQESLGSGYRKALLIDDFEAYRQNWLDTLRTHSLYQDKFRIMTVDGSYRWVFCQANAHYVNSKFDGYVGSIVDITEQELSSQAIRELSEKKDEFMSIASHELKTPLTSIKASIQLIARAISADNKVSQFAVKAAEQVLRLERLISDLLDVSKINSGRLVYNNTVFYFNEMLHEVVQSVQHTTQTHQIITEHSDKVILLGDRFRLEQVVYNFLSNAIKYSPEADKVIVSSQVRDNNLIVSIKDFGIGIARDNLGKAFDRYYRVDDTSTRFQGLGLGLFISAEIIKRHNGHFWVESETGKGSTFFFSLPLNDTSHPVKRETDNKTFYKDSQVDIWYDPENEWIEANWQDFQNIESIKHGCLEMLNLFEKNSCAKVLNDSSHVLGNWTEASEWAEKIWLPAMQKAGLRFFAWVNSENTFSKLAATKIADYVNGHIQMKIFDSKDEALTWLQNQEAFPDTQHVSDQPGTAELT
jgi:PAS domain S-box-containing protein